MKHFVNSFQKFFIIGLNTHVRFKFQNGQPRSNVKFLKKGVYNIKPLIVWNDEKGLKKIFVKNDWYFAKQQTDFHRFIGIETQIFEQSIRDFKTTFMLHDYFISNNQINFSEKTISAVVFFDDKSWIFVIFNENFKRWMRCTTFW